ncbi:MAG: hypothetical protein H0V09_07765 [Gemmatimonadetes bacterium]|nr:hypothetical protein [Gemmatimonadota bacterium]
MLALPAAPGLPAAMPLPEGNAAAQTLDATLAARRAALPKARTAYQETFLTAPPGGARSEKELRLAAKVAVFQQAPRERLEIRPVSGGTFAEPVVVVGDGRGYFLVTKVGSSPLGGSARASDPLVLQALASMPDAAGRKRQVKGADGGLQAVVLREPRRAEFSGDAAFALKPSRTGGGLLKKGLASFGESDDTAVTASAGARGADEIETPEGRVSVTPDSSAVVWLESREVGPLAYEDFLREGGLGPYAAAEAR